LGVYLLPVPIDGVYRVEMTGAGGIYEFSSYIYDTNGEVNMQTFKGLTNENEKDLFEIKIAGEGNQVRRKIDISGILGDWNLANSQGKIKKSLFYTSVKSLLLLVEKYINQNNVFTPLFIDSNTSKAIVSEIDSLLANFKKIPFTKDSFYLEQW